MIGIDDPRELPGYKKKSFILPFNGGEIWCEHLDGIYGNEDLVLQKLAGDLPLFTRPSSTSCIAVAVAETVLTDNIINALVSAFTNTAKKFTRVAFIGADSYSKRLLRKKLKNCGFAVKFIDDFEKAKEWLVSEKY